MKFTASNIKSGLELFDRKIEQGYSYLAPNVMELTFDALSSNKDNIHAAIEYIRLVGSNTSIFQIQEDHVTDSLKIQISTIPVQNLLKTYNSLTSFKIFDDRKIAKEIICNNSEHAKELMAIALVLCKFGLYSGYSYDYTTKRLTVF